MWDRLRCGLLLGCGCASTAIGTDDGAATLGDTSGMTTDGGSTLSSDEGTTSASATSSAGPTTAGTTGSVGDTTGTTGGSSSTGALLECEGAGDCDTGICEDGLCAIAVDCADLSDRSPGLASSEYMIDPDGPGGGLEPFAVYCDMVTDGGGWTLIMKLTSGTPTLGFDAVFWTDDDVLNSDETTPNVAVAGDNAKYRSFNETTGDALRLEWVEPTLSGHAFIYDALAGRTALELFAGPEELLFGSEADACNPSGLIEAPGYLDTAMRHGQGHQFYGINGTDTDPGGTQSGAIRFGFGSNDEDSNGWFPYQGIGANGASLVWGEHTDCNNCGCYGTAPTFTEVSANLWVR